MNNLFLPFELALKAKEKGFDQDCFNKYNNAGELIGLSEYSIQSDERTLAPLYQQVVDWFREKHNLVLDVYQEFNDVDAYTGFWAVDISELRKYRKPHIVEIEETYADYYEAWNKAIEEALKVIL